MPKHFSYFIELTLQQPKTTQWFGKETHLLFRDLRLKKINAMVYPFHFLTFILIVEISLPSYPVRITNNNLLQQNTDKCSSLFIEKLNYLNYAEKRFS